MTALPVAPPAEYAHALSEFELGGLRLRNRVFMSAHGTNYPSAGYSTDKYANYLAERAKGGIGLIITEGTHVAPTSGGPHMIHIWRTGDRADLRRLTDGVHEYGGRVFAQLMHNGRQNEPVMLGRSIVGPSAVRDPAHSFSPHALSRAEIAELVEAFAAGAQVAADNGFDGVELHAAHGYLIEQFLSPFMNQRTDEYGGSHENRLRFGRDVMRAVLDRVGDRIVVGARTTAFESVAGGFGRDEALEFTTELAAEGLHFVSISAGQHASPLLVVPPAGVPTLPFLDDIVAARKAVDCAVFASHRVRHLADVDRVIADGHADMVNMSRGHIADPDIVNKAASGRAHLTRPCIGCVQGCRGQLVLNLPIGCLVNPRVGREREHTVAPTADPQRIAVVGGGIAGMQFASTAAERGHDVTVFEKNAELGGAFARSAVLPERGEVAGFTRVLAAELDDRGVTVELGHAPSGDELDGFDRVVVAVGAARRALDPTEWPDSQIAIVDADAAMSATAPVGRRVVILDRGDHHNVALLLARRFAEQGASGVDVLDPTGPVARKLDSLNRTYLSRNFAEEHIRLASSVTELVVEGDTVAFVHDGWPQRLTDVGLLVVIEPHVQSSSPVWADGRDVLTLGDADAPGLAVEIVHQAYASALEF